MESYKSEIEIPSINYYLPIDARYLICIYIYIRRYIRAKYKLAKNIVNDDANKNARAPAAAAVS